MGFSGFSDKTLRFLLENRMNNSKQWYDSHKDEYKKYVYNPFVELVNELAPVVLQIDCQIITVPSRIISRVRRDTRFTKDKTLYRDNAWIVFLRDKSRMSTSPCFWFEINQTGSSYGVGYYQATPQTLAAMRKMIIERHPAFLSALKCYESQDEFTIGGEMYKKSKAHDQPENIKTWIDRKNIYFENVQNNYSLAFSKELPDVLKKGFLKLKPIYDFFILADSMVY
ncbi:MAG: DUF2461 domain-containing protein [Clostridiaceae bacterium]|nr:DUF2461 domain-containing protein [Clostridiaceae bacterium]